MIGFPDRSPGILVGKFLLVFAMCFCAPPCVRAQGTNFLPAVNYPVPGTGGLAVGDFNGDGKIDAVIANGTVGQSTVSILLGNGDGTFQAQYTVNAVASIGPYSSYLPVAVAVGDFNGDGKADLAVLCTFAPDPTKPTIFQGTVNILLSNGNGTFGSPTVIPLDGTSPSFVQAADFRNNGRTDLAVVNAGSGTVTILLGNGDGTFQAGVDYATVASPEGFAIGDLNGDGYPDLVIAGADGSNGAVSVLLGSQGGTFGPKSDYVICTPSFVGICAPPTGAGIGDFNGDGKPDIVASDGCGNSLYVLLGNGDGTFRVSNIPSEAGPYPQTCALAVGDFNGDGKSDVAETQDTLYYDLKILLGNGDGTFAQPVTLGVGLAGIDAGASDILSADLIGNHLPDLVLATNGGQGLGGTMYNGVTVLLNCGLACSNTALTSSAATSAFEQPLTLTATMTAGNAKATHTPTGSVIFQDVTATPAATLGTTTISGGTATLQYAGLTVGVHMIQATYQGDSNFDSSTSAQIQQTVTQGMPTVSATSSADPSSPGQSVTFTVTVQPTSPVAPTGSVTLSDNGTVTLSSTLSGGTATFTTSSLTTETHSITFNYGGDSNFQSATSSTLTQIVGANATPFVVGSSPTSASVSAGSSAQFTISLAAVPGFKSMVTFSCSGLPAMSACQFGQASLNPNGTTVTTSLTITTTGSSVMDPSARFLELKYELEILAIFGSLGLTWLLWVGRKRDQRRTPTFATCALLFAIGIVVAVAGCGGGYSAPKNNGTPAGTSTITVTAASSNASTSTTVTLTVQ